MQEFKVKRPIFGEFLYQNKIIVLRMFFRFLLPELSYEEVTKKKKKRFSDKKKMKGEDRIYARFRIVRKGKRKKDCVYDGGGVEVELDKEKDNERKKERQIHMT